MHWQFSFKSLSNKCVILDWQQNLLMWTKSTIHTAGWVWANYPLLGNGIAPHAWCVQLVRDSCREGLTLAPERPLQPAVMDRGSNLTNRVSANKLNWSVYKILYYPARALRALGLLLADGGWGRLVDKNRDSKTKNWFWVPNVPILG